MKAPSPTLPHFVGEGAATRPDPGTSLQGWGATTPAVPPSLDGQDPLPRGGGGSGRGWWILAAALLLWAWVCVPAIAGARTFYLRDVFTTHLPYKAFGAAELRAGRIPAFNPSWGLGQPFRGNPNALPFYPGNLFYLVLPFWSAFNLHYALHWLISLAAMAALARGLGQSPVAALTAGITYAGSGWMLSTLTYYNLLTVAAWWPLVLLGAVRGGRRGTALGGLACGLALLGGEPVTAALGLVPLLLVAVSRHGWRRGILLAVAIGGVGVLVALPQIVAFLRALPFTVRGAHGVTASQAAYYRLHPLRLLELVVPFPFGRPGWLGIHGIWAHLALPRMPLFLSLYSGLVGLWLAALGSLGKGHRRGWALLAAAGLALAAIVGLRGDWLVQLGFGLFRYPEKLLFWFALALPLLAGWGLEECRERGRRPAVWSGWSALVLAAVAGLAALLVPPLLPGWLPTEVAAERIPDIQVTVRAQAVAWGLGLAVGGAALILAVPAARAGRLAAVAGLQLACLCLLYPLALTDSTEPFRRRPPWQELLPPGAAVVHSGMAIPKWIPNPRYQLPSGPRAVLERQKVLDLHPVPGILNGLTYPLAPDLEGMASPLFRHLHSTLPRLSWQERARWIRLAGADAAVLFAPPQVPELLPLAQADRRGAVARLYRVADPVPAAWWPRRILLVSDEEEAVRTAGRLPDAVATAVTSGPVAHHPEGTVRVLALEPDRIVLEVEGRGGVAVVRRAYQPRFAARAGPRPLRTLPVNGCLLGVEVPPGRYRVTLEVSSRPEEAAAGAAFLTLLGIAWVLTRVPTAIRTP